MERLSRTGKMFRVITSIDNLDCFCEMKNNLMSCKEPKPEIREIFMTMTLRIRSSELDSREKHPVEGMLSWNPPTIPGMLS